MGHARLGAGKLWKTLLLASCILLSACGGGESARSSLHTADVANPLRGPATTVASQQVTADLGRRRALGVVPTTPDGSADQLFNWAEINFPQYFPSHSTTLLEGPWRYRSYMQTGVLLGLNAGDVYVTGGPFGGQLLKVGRAEDFVKPVIPVQRSSYENKFLAGQITGPIVKPWPASKFVPNEEITAGIALGDFFQDGSLSVVAFSNTFDNPSGPANLAGRAYFFRSEAGKWVDRTSLLLTDQTGCISPRKVLVADFNGDGKPDVFASCTGYDGPVNGKLPGEHPRLLLSQPDGTYKNTPFQLNCYCHSSAAADVRGDGYADIVVQDNATEGVAYFVNNKDGSFTMDRSRVPVSAQRFGASGEYTRGIWTVELVDVWHSGRYELFLGGVDKIDCPGCGWVWKSKIYRNNGRNAWSDNSVLELPSLESRATDVYDMLVVDGNLYLLRDGPAQTLSELSMAIQRINMTSLASTAFYSHTGVFSNGYTTMIEWIIFHEGKIKGFYPYPDVTTGI